MSEHVSSIVLQETSEETALRKVEEAKLGRDISVDEYVDAYKSLGLTDHATEKDAKRFLSDPRRDALGLRHVTEGEIVRMILKSDAQVK